MGEGQRSLLQSVMLCGNSKQFASLYVTDVAADTLNKTADQHEDNPEYMGKMKRLEFLPASLTSVRITTLKSVITHL